MRLSKAGEYAEAPVRVAEEIRGGCSLLFDLSAAAAGRSVGDGPPQRNR
jgi:hypothetical protein